MHIRSLYMHDTILRRRYTRPIVSVDVLVTMAKAVPVTVPEVAFVVELVVVVLQQPHVFSSTTPTLNYDGHRCRYRHNNPRSLSPSFAPLRPRIRYIKEEEEYCGRFAAAKCYFPAATGASASSKQLSSQ